MFWDKNMDFQCRICLENGSRKDFIAPCRCSGSSKWVHRSCLDRWRAIREEKAFYNCTVCLSEYTFMPSGGSFQSQQCSERAQFVYLVSRDLFVFLLSLSLVIGVLAVFVYKCDYQMQLISTFHMNAQPGVRIITSS